MNELISVVVPVYNVEKYLRQSIESIINQTYKNLQIILVDDGSTDNSGRICDEYAAMDNRITVIHQDNKGAGAAKNTGLDLVEGRYFSIIDSDDFIDLSFFEVLLSKLVMYNGDIVQCLVKNVFIDNYYCRKYNFTTNKDKKLTMRGYLFELLYDWKYAIFANKLFKSSLLKDIRFPIGRKIDDEFFTYKLICNAKRIINISDTLYNYRMRKSSVMNENIRNILVKDRIDCFIERYDFISNKCPSVKYEFYVHLSNYIQSNKDAIDSITFNKLSHTYPMVDKSMIRKIYRRIKMNSYESDSSRDFKGECFD